jgi:hypothetical protein
MEGVTPQQVAHYTSLNFFYAGKPNKKNQPVFYLIASRSFPFITLNVMVYCGLNLNVNRVSESLLDSELRPVIAYVSAEIKRVIGIHPSFIPSSLRYAFIYVI